MDKHEATTAFRRADEHFRAGNYAESLEILRELDVAFPNTHRVLFPMARCHAELGNIGVAIDLCDRLIRDHQYERAATLKQRLLGKVTEARFPMDEPEESPQWTLDSDGENRPTKSRFKLRPMRFVVLGGVGAGMYYGYLPYWAGGVILGAYFAVPFVIKRALYRLFEIPFRMKGSALRGATAILHGVKPAPLPENDDENDDDDNKPARPLEYVWVDITVTPPEVSTGKFTAWEAGELALLDYNRRVRSMDVHGQAFAICDLCIIQDGEEVADEGTKYFGPQRIKFRVGIDPAIKRYKLLYYFEAFGDIPIP